MGLLTSWATVSMRAILVSAYGTAADALHYTEDFKMPRPKRGEVLVRQLASSVNIIDIARRSGYGRQVFELRYGVRLPFIPGEDVCGVVETVGRGVQGFRKGDLVFGAKPPCRFGSYAEFVTVGADHLAPAPSSMEAGALATMPYSFLTAWTALVGSSGMKPGDFAGKKVFVQGGAGAVGSMAVQIAKRFGAEVAVSCSGDDTDYARRIGASVVFDRRADHYAAELSDYDVALCTADPSEEMQMLSILKRRGSLYATVIHPTLTLVDQHGILAGLWKARQTRRAAMQTSEGKGRRIEWVLFEPSREGLDTLSAMCTEGAMITPKIAQHFPLEEAASAHLAVEAGSRGKVVLDIGSP